MIPTPMAADWSRPLHVVLLETTSVRGFQIVKEYAERGIEVTFIAETLDFFRNDIGFEDIRYATRVLEIPGLATAWDLADRLHGLLGPNPVSGVICRVEDYLAVGSVLAQAWGLPHEDLNALKLLADKDAVRARLREEDLGNLRWQGVTDVNSGVVAAQSIGYPVVVKPAFGGYSLNVAVVWNEAEAVKALKEVCGVSGHGHPKAVVEEFAFGLNVSVELIVQDGRVTLLGCSELRAQLPGVTAEMGRHFPADFAGRGAATQFAIAAVRAVGLRNSAIHMELIITPTGPELVEINGRVAGHVMTRVMSLALGRSISDDLLRLAIGKPLAPLEPSRQTVTLRHLWFERSGTVTAVDIPDDLGPGLETFELSIDVGSTVSPLRSNWERVGYVIAKGHDANASNQNAQLVAEKILEGISIAWEPDVDRTVQTECGPHILVVTSSPTGAWVTTDSLLAAAGSTTGHLSVVDMSDGGSRDGCKSWEARYRGRWLSPGTRDESIKLVKQLNHEDPVDLVITFDPSMLELVFRLRAIVSGSREPLPQIPSRSFLDTPGHIVLILKHGPSRTLLAVIDCTTSVIASTGSLVQPSRVSSDTREMLAGIALDNFLVLDLPDGLVHAWYPNAESNSPQYGWGVSEALKVLLDSVGSRDLISAVLRSQLGWPLRASTFRRHQSIVELALSPAIGDAKPDTPSAESQALIWEPELNRSALVKSETDLRTHILILDRVWPPLQGRNGQALFPTNRFRISVLSASGEPISNGTNLPDQVVELDVFDEASVVAEARRVHSEHPVDYVITLRERLLSTAAVVRTALQVAGDTEEYAASFRDKSIMKQRAVAGGIRHARGAVVRATSELVDAHNSAGSVVVKPRSGAGSKDVAILRTKNDVAAWLDASFEPDVYLWEEYISFPMCHIDAVIHERTMIWEVSEYVRPPVTFSSGEPTSSVSAGDSALRKSALDLLNRIVLAWGVSAGVLHIEAFWDGQELIFCEVACRAGGGGIVDAFRITRGIDLEHAKMLIDSGQSPWTVADVPMAPAAGWSIHYSPTGVLVNIDDSAFIGDAFVTDKRSPGDHVSAPIFAGDGVATYVFGGGDADEVRAQIASCEGQMVIEVVGS